MERKALLTLILGTILFIANPAHAQVIGERMRITTEEGKKFIGRLKGYNADSLIILTNSIEQSIAYADMVRLQRSLGGRTRYKNSAMIGLGAGMVVGLVAAGDITGAAEQFATVAGVGLLGGMGGLAKARIRREKWERVDIPNQGAVSVMPDLPDQDAAPVMPTIGVQSPGPLALANRMRITTENGEELIGQMKEFDAHSLTILTGFTEQSIAYADMVQLQRSLGVRSYSRDGARMGVVVGAGGSIAVAAILRKPEVALGGIGLFTPVLALGGMISGAAIRRERWEHLDLPDQDAAPVMPTIGVQPPGPLALANRMRITTENGEELIGQMQRYDADSLTIVTNATEQSIAYADMVRLQRSLGVRSHVIKGTLIGLGAGLVVGTLAAINDECTNTHAYSCFGVGWVVFLMGTGGGTLLGMLVGATSKREKWERLDIPGQSAASVMPIIGVHPGGRLALGARISF